MYMCCQEIFLTKLGGTYSEMKGKLDVRLIELINKIEEKRLQMIEIALKKGLSSKETVEISHQLDNLLMAYHKRKYKTGF